MNSTEFYFLINFFSIFFTFTIAQEVKDWATCEKFPKEFMCYNWCLRLNRYTQRYLAIRLAEEEKWRAPLKYMMNFVIPIGVVLIIWKKALTIFVGKAVEMKKRIHEKKLKLLNKRSEARRSPMERPYVQEPVPDSTEERPILEEVVQQIREKRTDAKKFFEYRRKMIKEEKRIAEPQLMKSMEQVQVPTVSDFDFCPGEDEPFTGKRMEFDDEEAEWHWKVEMLDDKGQQIQSSMVSELDVSRKN